MLQHVVEREEAPEENFRRSHPAVADVLGTQSLEDRPAEDPAHVPFLQAVFGGQPVGDQGLDESKGLPAIHLEIQEELCPGEEAAAVQTGQGNPFGFSSRPAEGLQGVLAFLEMLNRAVTSTCTRTQASTSVLIQPPTYWPALAFRLAWAATWEPTLAKVECTLDRRHDNPNCCFRPSLKLLIRYAFR